MSIKSWFPTLIYSKPLKTSDLKKYNRELSKECQQIRDYDLEGQKWSEKHYVGGYTSYHSMPELHRFSSTFMELEKIIDRHVKSYLKALEYDLQGRSLQMSDCWLNIMPGFTAHGLHIHPLSVISGTYYVQTPKNCSAIKFEDPRLDRFMAAPPRKSNCKAASKQFVEYAAIAGNLVLFESWLRHEVPASAIDQERISISFNYNWD